MECKVAAVGNVHLSYAFCRCHISNLHLVRTVYDHPQSRTIHLDVVAHITQFLYCLRIHFRVYVTMVLCFCKVKEIESTLVAAHIPFTKNIHAADVATRLSASTRIVCCGINDGVICTARGQQSPYYSTQYGENQKCGA